MSEDYKVCPFGIDNDDRCDAHCTLYDGKTNECSILSLIRDVNSMNVHMKNILKLLSSFDKKAMVIGPETDGKGEKNVV